MYWDKSNISHFKFDVLLTFPTLFLISKNGKEINKSRVSFFNWTGQWTLQNNQTKFTPISNYIKTTQDHLVTIKLSGGKAKVMTTDMTFIGCYRCPLRQPHPLLDKVVHYIVEAAQEELNCRTQICCYSVIILPYVYYIRRLTIILFKH